MTVPSSGGSSPSSMSIVVDFPAPFGPSRATVSPGAIEMSTPRTACTGPSAIVNVLRNPVSSIPAVRSTVWAWS